MAVPSREQPRIFPGGSSVAGIPKVGGVASGVPAFPHEDVHQVGPEEEEAQKEGEQEDEEEEAEEDEEGEEPKDDEEQEQQQRRAVASATTGTTRL